MTATACAWNTVCATWTLHGVDPAQLQVIPVSGVGQSVLQTAALGPVEVLVTDGAGHPVQDAALTIHQRVLSWEGSCSGPSRCPAAAVLANSDTSAVSSPDGSLAVTPLQVTGVPQTVEIAISYGSFGFLTINLVVRPN